jgi:hypothetical protein
MREVRTHHPHEREEPDGEGYYPKHDSYYHAPDAETPQPPRCVAVKEGVVCLPA